MLLSRTFLFIKTTLEYVGSGPIGNSGMMSTAGAAQLTAGLNGPASGLSQIVRRFSDTSQILPRGSGGASGPQFGGLSIVSSSKRGVVGSRSAKNAHLAGRLRQLRNEVQRHLRQRRQKKRRSRVRHNYRHKHGTTTKRTRRHLTTTRTENDSCKLEIVYSSILLSPFYRKLAKHNHKGFYALFVVYILKLFH